MDSEDGATFRVKSYFAVQFHALRRALLANNDEGEGEEEKHRSSATSAATALPVSDFGSAERLFIQSLSQCIPWAATGGKSNSSFCKTLDDRFVVKCVTAHEFDMFLDVAGKFWDLENNNNNNKQQQQQQQTTTNNV